MIDIVADIVVEELVTFEWVAVDDLKSVPDKNLGLDWFGVVLDSHTDYGLGVVVSVVVVGIVVEEGNCVVGFGGVVVAADSVESTDSDFDSYYHSKIKGSNASAKFGVILDYYSWIVF